MKTYELNQYDLSNIIEEACSRAVRKTLIAVGMQDPTIKRPQAIKVYGREKIEFWEKIGLVHRIQKGMKATYYYKIEELINASYSCDRHLYVTAKERRS